MGREKVVLCWSGGKDSAMAAWELRRSASHELASLLTTVTEGYERIAMHGVRRELLERQADALGLPLRQVLIPQGADNAVYEARMAEALAAYRDEGLRTVAFGDIFLEDLRAYRERNLARLGLAALFPLWKRDTAELPRAFIALGFKAVLACVDTRVLDASFAGAAIDEDLLRRLPPHVDPCGENGEFHSFVHDGPLFRRPVAFTLGEAVTRDGRFRFQDLVPT